MKSETKAQRKHYFNAPDAYVVLFVLVICAFFLTFVIPAGSFTVNEETYTYQGEEKTRTVIDPESFEYLLDENGDPDYLKGKIFSDYYADPDTTGVLNTMHNGFVNGGMDGTAGMIAFILIIGGSFAVVIRTGAIDAAIWTVIRKMKGKDILIIPVIMIVFSLGGAVMGLCEELIPFAMILIPLIIKLGYDAITAMCTCYCAMMVGFSTTWMNPFTLLIAQGIADVPLMSGAVFRIVLYIIAEGCLIAYTIHRALKCKKDPTFSFTYEDDEKNFRADSNEVEADRMKFEIGHILVLLTLLAGFVWLFWGVMKNGWYINHMSAQFIGVAVVSGAIGCIFHLNGMRINDIAGAFKQGLSDLVPVVMILALGKGITLVLGGVDNSVPSVLNTILHMSGDALQGLPIILSTWGMYLFQSCFNFLVCSGPAQAAIAMPIMAPLADLLGVTRQSACLAYQMGDGFTNMINPTSAALMAYLAIAKVDYGKWVKFQWKMQLILFGFGTCVMIAAVLIGF